MPSTWRVDNSTLHGGEITSEWQANHTYSVGARCWVNQYGNGYPTSQKRIFECTTGGMSGGSDPSWDSTNGNTTSDNAVTWTCRLPTDGNWDNATSAFFAIHYSNAGDTILVNKDHMEVWTNGRTIDLGYYALPKIIKCVDKSDDSLSSGGIFGNAGYSATLHIRGYGYFYGCKIVSGGNISLLDDGGNGMITIEGTDPTDWVLSVGDSNSGSFLNLLGGSSPACRLVVVNGGIKLHNAGNYITFGGNGRVDWLGGKLIAPNESSFLFLVGQGRFYGKFLDLSELCTGATARYLCAMNSSVCGPIILSRCKMPSGSGFNETKTDSPPGMDIGEKPVQLHHCSKDNKVNTLHEWDYYGEVFSEETIVRTDGASDGTTPFSYKMVSNTHTLDGGRVRECLQSPSIFGWLSTASEQTATVECIVDSATNLQNDEVWMELYYPKDNTSGLGEVAHGKCIFTATPSDVATSGETWTTTGMSNPNEFKLEVTFTPGKIGPYEVRVMLAKPSSTIYIDPMVTIV